MLRKLDQLRLAGLAFFAYFGGATNIVFVSGQSGIHRLVLARIYLANEIRVPPEKLLEIRAAGMPPRRITHEHEAAHAVVVHKGEGVVSQIEPSVMPLADGRISLGRAVWGPAGNQNTMLAGYAAGPAQTQISVERDGLDQSIADEALKQEGSDLAAMLQQKTGKPSLPAAAVAILEPAVRKLVA